MRVFVLFHIFVFIEFFRFFFNEIFEKILRRLTKLNGTFISEVIFNEILGIMIVVKKSVINLIFCLVQNSESHEKKITASLRFC